MDAATVLLAAAGTAGMILAAFALGLGRVRRFASAEMIAEAVRAYAPDDPVTAAVVAADGSAGLARTADGAVYVVKAQGLDAAVRRLPPDAIRRLRPDRARIAPADLGFPALDLAAPSADLDRVLAPPARPTHA